MPIFDESRRLGILFLVPGDAIDLDTLKGAWDAAGKDDPFWSVLSVRDKQKNRWDPQEFFRTGVDEIDQVLTHVRGLGIEVSPRRALDFGCGPGRLSQALATHFEQVDGVDISRSMIALANRLNQRADRCHYHLNESNDLGRFADQTFDFVYSSITLQHVGPANARSYLKEFIRVLVPGGTLVFQLPGRQTGRLRRLKTFAPAPVLAAYRRLRYHGHPAATMHGIPREDVVRFCESNGVAVLDVQANHEAGTGWESFRYYGRRVSSPDSRT
jgi:ubiquinone/menaquinone biosynthesis C-methylase UbiE